MPFAVITMYGHGVHLNCMTQIMESSFCCTKRVSEYDQEIPQSQTADKPMVL